LTNHSRLFSSYSIVIGQFLMALADRTRQSGNAMTNHCFVFSVLEPLESKMVIGHRVVASLLCRVLSARAITA